MTWPKMRFSPPDFATSKVNRSIWHKNDEAESKAGTLRHFHRHVPHNVRNPANVPLILSLSCGTNADFPRHSRSVSIKFIWCWSARSAFHTPVFSLLKQTAVRFESMWENERSGFKSSSNACIALRSKSIATHYRPDSIVVNLVTLIINSFCICILHFMKCI